MLNLEDTLRLLDCFRPEQGATIIPAPGAGKGFWSGGSFSSRSHSGDYYLYYRLRRPRSAPYEEQRGYQCRIDRSEKGESYQTVWTANKQDFGARSVEKGCLIQRTDGSWLFYISYDSEATERWQIDIMEADNPRHFDPAQRRPFFSHTDVKAHDIKDPHIVFHDEIYHIFANITTDKGVREQTLCILSRDGVNPMVIRKNILAPSSDNNAWDGYSARLTGILFLSDGFLMFYDGQRFGGEICEEDCGLCFSEALLGPYHRLTTEQPFLFGVRYAQGLWVNDSLMLFYEYTLTDGSHELRMVRYP